MRLIGFFILSTLFFLTPQSTTAQKRKSNCGKKPKLEITEHKLHLKFKEIIDAGYSPTVKPLVSEGAKNFEVISYYVCKNKLDYGISEKNSIRLVEIAFGITERESEGKKSITEKDIPRIIREYHKAINSAKYGSLLESLSFPMAKFHGWDDYSSYEVQNVLQADRETRTVRTEIDDNSIAIIPRSDQGYSVSYYFTQFDRYKDGSKKTFRVKEKLMINPMGRIYYIYQPETILQK